MARVPWSDTDGNPIPAALVTRMDYLVVLVDWLEGVATHTALALGAAKRLIQSQYNLDVQRGDFADNVRSSIEGL